MSQLNQERKNRNIASILAWICCLVLSPLTILIGAYFKGSSYIIVSTLVCIYSIVPFFVSFEKRKPGLHELVLLAVMIALTISARAAFALVPNFKPMAAIIMLCGIALGPSSGFLCGSVSMLVSNFMFGQGPWTPFQMLSYGLCGFVFGCLARLNLIKRDNWNMAMRVAVSTLSLVFYVLIAGPILDTSSVFWMLSTLTFEGALSIYLAGLPFNLMQGIASFITIFLIGNVLLSKITRVQKKYDVT